MTTTSDQGQYSTGGGDHAPGLDPECAVCAPKIAEQLLQHLERSAARWRRAEHYLPGPGTQRLYVVHRTSVLFPPDIADSDFAYGFGWDGSGNGSVERETALKILSVGTSISGAQELLEQMRLDGPDDDAEADAKADAEHWAASREWYDEERGYTG